MCIKDVKPLNKWEKTFNIFCCTELIPINFVFIISDVLLWTPTYGRAKAERPARTYIQQLCEDVGCYPEDLPEAMNDREKWRERGSGISVLAARHDDDDDDEFCF